MRVLVAAFAAVLILVSTRATEAQSAVRDRAGWIALAKGGFVLPDGAKPIDLLLEMNGLLASTDPVLRDDVAFSAAERWIVREGRVAPAEMRQLLQLWTGNLQDGLGEAAGDRVFKRSFSMLSLSLIAARDLTAPFLQPAEVQWFFDRALDYFQRETDLRGFDATRGWMHTPAHTADTLKFLGRNPKLGSGSDLRLLSAVRQKIEAADTVFAWGENDRIALALHAVVRRPDAEVSGLEGWVAHWVGEHKALWANGPQVQPRQFARVENAKQVMRSLHAALSMDAKPTPQGDSARQVLVGGLAKTR